MPVRRCPTASPHGHRPCEILLHFDGRASCTACGGRASTEGHPDGPMGDVLSRSPWPSPRWAPSLSGRIYRQCHLVPKVTVIEAGRE